jgi:hypothetical protein
MRCADRILVCLVCTLSTRCSTIDLDYLRNGRGGAAGREASTDAAAKDASMAIDDASGDDVAVDASSDAGDETTPRADAEAGGPTVPFCTDAGVLFCAAFDESPLPSGFQFYDGTFLSRSMSNSVSPPASLLVTVPSNLGIGSFASKLGESFVATGTTFTTSFAFLPRQVNTTTANGLLIWALDFTNNASAQYSVRMAYGGVPGSVRIEESYLGSKADVYHNNFRLPLNEWSTVVIEMSDLVADAGTGTLKVSVNGTPIGPTDTLRPPPGVILAPTVLVGAVFGNYPADGWTLQYDNFLFDMH